MGLIRHKTIAVNTAGTDYVVSDIHGNYTLLTRAMKDVNFNPLLDRLFSVGDIIDRGPDSESCLNLLLQPWFIPVLANHELALINLLNDSSAIDDIRHNGGEWINKHLNSPGIIRRWIELIKLRMPIAITIETSFGNVGITHAQPPMDWNDITNEKLDIIPLISSRSQIKTASQERVKNITYTVHGHTNVNHLTLISNRFWIDTLEKTENICLKSLEQLYNEMNNEQRKSEHSYNK